MLYKFGNYTLDADRCELRIGAGRVELGAASLQRAQVSGSGALADRHARRFDRGGLEWPASFGFNDQQPDRSGASGDRR